MNQFTAFRPRNGHHALARLEPLNGEDAPSGDAYISPGALSAPLLALHEQLLGSSHLDALLEQFLGWLRDQDLGLGLRLQRQLPACTSAPHSAAAISEQVLGTSCAQQTRFALCTAESPAAGASEKIAAQRTGARTDRAESTAHTLSLQVQHPRPLSRLQAELLTRAVNCLQRHLQLVEVLEQLQAMALNDPLTGLLNRKALQERLQRELARARRHHSSLSVMVIDVDHFKQINDRYGHQGGDHILCTLAQLFRQTVRDADLVFRHGGDEFVILLPETGLTQAHCLAQRLRAALAEQQWPAIAIDHAHPAAIGPVLESGQHSTELRPDISIGVAQYQAGDSPCALLHRADSQLYAVKHNGRGGVCAA